MNGDVDGGFGGDGKGNYVTRYEENEERKKKIIIEQEDEAKEEKI